LKRFNALHAAAAAVALCILAVAVAALPPSFRAQAGLQSALLSSATAPSSTAAAEEDSGDALSALPTDVARGRSALSRLGDAGTGTGASGSASGGEELSETQVMRRIGRLYRYQAQLMDARAAGDEARAGDVLDRAMRALSDLANEPGLWKNEQFQQVYTPLAEAYRAHYGAPDTLAATRGDIFAARDSLFAAVEAARAQSAFGLSDAPLLSQADADALAPKGTDVPLPVNDLTRGAMRFLQREPGDHVYRWMRRKATYFPMIEHIFAEAGVPDELKYLSMVESGLNPQAESRADAAGIWQFIPATARAYGLEVTPWVDERMNPVKATRAAARHLKDLYRLFDGDWHLALSGYNCSPGRIREAMRTVRSQGREPTFWNIYPHIPRETRNSVPTYVAAALMLSNPSQFGLKHVQPGPRYRFDQAPVDGMLPLKTAARLAGTTVEQIRALNPSLRRDVLPPSAEPFGLRLPYGTYETFSEGYRALPDSAKGLTLTHRVKDGETPGGIAERYGISLDALRKANQLSGDLTIAAGDRLVVPSTGSDVASPGALADAQQGPRRVQYGSRTLRPLAASSGTLPGTPIAGRGGAITEDVTTYRVKRGDTLYGIARRYDVSVADLQQWNDLAGSGLSPGQKLTVRS
jgi:membrane-bound lytic murein transglycosylase D